MNTYDVGKFVWKLSSVVDCRYSACCAPSGHALIRYSNLGSAVYAKEKLNGFEYPPGNRLVVNFFDDGEDRSRCSHMHAHSPMHILNVLRSQ